MPPSFCLPVPKKTSPTSKTSHPTHPHRGKNSCGPPWKFRLVDPATPPKPMARTSSPAHHAKNRSKIQIPSPDHLSVHPLFDYRFGAPSLPTPHRLHRLLVWPFDPPQGHPPSTPPQGPRLGHSKTLMNCRNFKHHDVGRTLPAGDQDMLPCG